MNYLGPFTDEWKKTIDNVKDVEQVDISIGMSSAAMAVKDEKELVNSDQLGLGQCKLIGYSAQPEMLLERLVHSSRNSTLTKCLRFWTKRRK